jgi:hypothetical protein
VSVKTRAEGRGRLEAAMRLTPSRFAARGRWGTDELAKPVEHPLIPEDRIVSEVAAFPDQRYAPRTSWNRRRFDFVTNRC